MRGTPVSAHPPPRRAPTPSAEPPPPSTEPPPAPAKRGGSTFFAALLWTLLLAAAGGAGYFYLFEYQPVVEQHAILFDSHHRTTENLNAVTSQLEERDTQIVKLEKNAADLKGKLASVTGPIEQAQADLAILRTELSDPLETAIDSGDVVFLDSGDDLGIQIASAALFRVGSVQLTTKGTKIITAIGESLKKTPTQRIQIRAHVDSKPVVTPKVKATYPTHWDLTSAYASLIARVLTESAELPPTHLSVAGYADTRPLPGDSDSNARIELILLGPQVANEPAEPAKEPADETEQPSQAAKPAKPAKAAKPAKPAKPADQADD